MQVRKVTVQEYLQVEKLQSISFMFPKDVEALSKKIAETPEQVDYHSAWACFDEDGRAISALENYPFAMHYDGHVVGSGGIGGVVSAPESRRKGNIRALFGQVFADDLAEGRVFSVLFPFSHAYYRQFGYELCHEGRVMELQTDALAKFKLSADVRMIESGEDSAPFAPIYDAYAARYNYAVARNALAWRRILWGETFKTEAYRYVLSRDGRGIAYCMFRPERQSESNVLMHLYDYAYVDKAALHELLGFLYRLRALIGNIRLELPDGFELSALLDEPYDLKPVRLRRTMARVVDAQAALRLMRHPASAGAYTIEVRDDFLPQNAGVYRVTFGGGEAAIARAEPGTPCDLRVSAQALAPLCIGHLSLDMAAYRDDVALLGNEETLRSVFVRKPKFMTDAF